MIFALFPWDDHGENFNLPWQRGGVRNTVALVAEGMYMGAFELKLIGRIVFGVFFVVAGIRNFAAFGERREFKTNYGWPLPAPLLAIGFGVQLLAGFALIFGVVTVWAALALIFFLALATPLYHNLFLFRGKERDPHLYLTLVNITLCSGLLMIVAEAI
ncbi:MAG: DoxX family protein [Rhizobiaceae bacterium]